MIYKDTNMAEILTHAVIGFAIRVILSVYSTYHDKHFKLPYTDIDYKVFTDASKRILEGGSPYDRDGYRYTPLIALLTYPDALGYAIFGKIVFSVFDVLLSILIFVIVQQYVDRSKAKTCAFLWLYNPLAIVIASRGSADSVPAALVLASLLLHCQGKYKTAGIMLGISAHVKLYPIIFLLPMVLTTKRENPYELRKRFFTKEKFGLVISFSICLAAVTYVSYVFYGKPFIDQAIMYHVNRTDFRHNLSPYFYLQYLNIAEANPTIYKILISAPQILLVAILPFKYQNPRDLPFVMFLMSFVFVVFNRVITSQYFIWFFSLLPIFLPTISIPRKKVYFIISSWVFTQAVWFGFAYLLEYEGVHTIGEYLSTFTCIWIASLLFFLSNVYVYLTFSKAYNVQYKSKKVE